MSLIMGYRGLQPDSKNNSSKRLHTVVEKGGSGGREVELIKVCAVEIHMQKGMLLKSHERLVDSFLTICNLKSMHASLQKGNDYFCQYIWLSQLHICSLNTWHWTGVYIECAECVGYPLSDGCSSGSLSSTTHWCWLCMKGIYVALPVTFQAPVTRNTLHMHAHMHAHMHLVLGLWEK